jgi:hypothetical protein
MPPAELKLAWLTLRYPLTAPRQFDILQSGPGWQGTECNSIDCGASSSRFTAPTLLARARLRPSQPVVGLTYKILPEMTFYTGYSEANRRPDPTRIRLLQSIEVLPAGRVPGVRSAAPAGSLRARRKPRCAAA